MGYSLAFQEVTERAPSDEVKALAQMARTTFAHTFTHYDPADLEAYLEGSLSDEVVAREVAAADRRFVWILENGRRAGFLKWVFPGRVYLEHAHPPLDCRSPFLLERLYFLPELCGRGLGDIAMAYLNALARHQKKADYLYLSVWDRNYRAQRFYQRHGFRTIGSFDYPVGRAVDHELLYGKPLR